MTDKIFCRIIPVFVAVFILLGTVLAAFPVEAADALITNMVVSFPVIIVGETRFGIGDLKIKQVSGEIYSAETDGFVTVSSLTYSDSGDKFSSDSITVTVEYKTVAGHAFTAGTKFTSRSSYSYQIDIKSSLFVDKYTMRVVYTLNPVGASTMTLGLPEFRIGSTLQNVLDSISVAVEGASYKKNLQVMMKKDGIALATFGIDTNGKWKVSWGTTSLLKEKVAADAKYDTEITVNGTSYFIDNFVFLNPEAADSVTAQGENLGATIVTSFSTGAVVLDKISLDGATLPVVDADISEPVLTPGWYYKVVSSAIINAADNIQATGKYVCGDTYRLLATVQTDSGFTFNNSAAVEINGTQGVIKALSDDKKTAVVAVVFPPLEHSAVSSTAIGVTCRSDGLVVSSCIICGKLLSSAVVPSGSHVYLGGVCVWCGVDEPVETTAATETTASPSETTSPEETTRKPWGEQDVNLGDDIILNPLHWYQTSEFYTAIAIAFAGILIFACVLVYFGKKKE